jgi:hypothetical protein
MGYNVSFRMRALEGHPEQPRKVVQLTKLSRRTKILAYGYNY